MNRLMIIGQATPSIKEKVIIQLNEHLHLRKLNHFLAYVGDGANDILAF